MWEATIGFKYKKGYGMQHCVYSGDSWEDAYTALYDAFHTTTGGFLSLCDTYKTMAGECMIEQDKPCEIIHKHLPVLAPSNAIGMVYAITRTYE